MLPMASLGQSRMQADGWGLGRATLGMPWQADQYFMFKQRDKKRLGCRCPVNHFEPIFNPFVQSFVGRDLQMA